MSDAPLIATAPLSLILEELKDCWDDKDLLLEGLNEAITRANREHAQLEQWRADWRTTNNALVKALDDLAVSEAQRHEAMDNNSTVYHGGWRRHKG